MKAFLPHHRRTSLLAIAAGALVLPALPVAAQTYTYDPTISGAEQWETSAKWGLTAPEYPDGTGIIAKIRRVASNSTLSLNNKSITVGDLYIGETGSGSGTWRIESGTITFAHTLPTQMSKLYVAGATATIASNLQALNGLEFTGATSATITNTSSRINGLKHSSAAALYIYNSPVISGQIEMSSSGSIRLGSGTDLANNTFDNDFLLSGDSGKTAWIYGNTTSRIVLTGNITGTANLLLGTEGPSRNEIMELQGNNSYSGNTAIRTNIHFHSINNFGKGSLTFENNARTLSYADGNTADITKNSDEATRAVAVNIDTTIDTGANAVTYANAITGTSRLIKSGSGALTLAGDNTFAGVTISEGRVIADHDHALGSSDGSLVIGDGGHLEILGDRALAVDSLELEEGAGLSFHLGEHPGASPFLFVDGDQIGADTYTISIIADGLLTAGETYTLLSIGGNASAANFILDPLSLDLGLLSWDQGSGALTFQAIPEPGSITLAAAALGIIACFIRKRQCQGAFTN